VAVNAERAQRDIFIFPLNTVLFPEGKLALKIFEQRYLEMTKACLRDNAPFGVCLIREGTEVGEPAVPQGVGCLASITHWDMPQLGLFHLTTRGEARFTLRETRVAPNGLISALVELFPEERATEMDPACQQVLKVIIDRTGAVNFPSPLKLDDAQWVSYRLAETLPLPLQERQELLESDTATRFERLRDMLVRQGVLTD
jgi:Lon protease-like protein